MRNGGHPPGGWYAETAGPGLDLAAVQGEVRCDVCVVGGGFTGLGAALELAGAGASVRLLEAAEVGSGGSGRNGGQIHTGQRREQPWLEARLGLTDARRLWDLAEAARDHLLALSRTIDCDLRPGLLHARHRKGGEGEDARFIAHMSRVYGCDRYELLDAPALAQALGTEIYHGGLIDRGGGHLHPLKLAQGMARAVLAAGGVIHERSFVRRWRRTAAGFVVETPRGQVVCRQLILTGDGYVDGLSPALEARVMPIQNFIAVTEPLDDPAILPGGEAAADSRFVVRYWRRTPDGRLLFGGGESYVAREPADIAALVRRHLLEVYPQLGAAKITHAWGGALGVTFHRLPYVRELVPGVWTAAGYSGQGVMLAPYVGRALALATQGDRAEVDLMARLPCPPFPGGRLLRWPVLAAGMSWYALRDRVG
jgi:gamma-glutamylputrescine oxidase